MSDDKSPPPKTSVGYKNPPKNRQFKKGQSGNRKGRPNSKATQTIDLDALLDTPVMVKKDGKPTKMQPKEVELRKFLEKALKKKDLKAIDYLLNLFIEHEAIKAEQGEMLGGVLTLPSNIPWALAVEAVTTIGAPPWSKEELAPLIKLYKEHRTPEDAAYDEAIGFDI